MALSLARMLVEQKAYLPQEAKKAYILWLNSEPFDCGATVSAGLRDQPNRHSQANGALMRISPLGIFGANRDPEQVAEWARQDAALTHPHPICLQINALFAVAIARGIRSSCDPRELFQQLEAWAKDWNVDQIVMRSIARVSKEPPADYLSQQGWVVIAFQNALWQLLHAPTLEEGVIDTIMRGGDTDTNAAIAGALLGAVYGREAIPKQWVDSLLNCRPEAGQPNVHHPRPTCFWPVDALELAKALLVSNE
jgi:ADP-ribosylglycohydrolase